MKIIPFASMFLLLFVLGSISSAQTVIQNRSDALQGPPQISRLLVSSSQLSEPTTPLDESRAGSQVTQREPLPANDAIVERASTMSGTREGFRYSLSNIFENQAAEPSNGSGQNVTITYTVVHPSGVKSLKYIYAQISRQVTTRNSCYIRFDTETYRLQLLNDTGTDWVAPGHGLDSQKLQNSQCSVSTSMQLRIENNGILRLTISYDFFPSYAGIGAIYMYSEDLSGVITGWTRVGTWNIPSSDGNLLPYIKTIAHTEGHVAFMNLELTVSDPDGPHDLRGFHVLINDSLAYANGCYAYFDTVRSELFLLDDSTSRFLGPLVPGSASVVHNTKCLIRGETLAVKVTEDSVTLSVRIDFTESAAGPNSIWTLLEDSSKTWLGWKKAGDIVVSIGSSAAPPGYDDLTVTPTTNGAYIITVSATSSKGPEAIEDIYFLINTTKVSTMGCYIMLRSSTQQLYFLSDDGIHWQDIDYLGSNRYASTRACSLEYRNARFYMDGGKAKAQIVVRPHIITDISRYIWIYVQDTWGLTSGWSTGSKLAPALVSVPQDLSLVLSPGSSVSASTMSPPPPSSPWRVEFYVHDWSNTPSTVSEFIQCSALGFRIAAYGNGDIEFVSSNGVARLPTSGRTGFIARLQKLPQRQMYSLELWNVDGTGYIARQLEVPQWNEQTSSGCTVNNPSLETFSPAFAFFRISTSTVQIGERQPIPSESGDLLDWRFDGFGNDSSSYNWHTIVFGGRFGNTSGIDTLVAKPLVEGFDNAPSWMLQPVVNAAGPVRLSGSKSISMRGGRNSPQCVWEQVRLTEDEALTSTVSIEHPNACVTDISNLSFGPYKFRLTVSDGTGNSSSQEIEFGAVRASDDGIVEYPDPRLNTLLGPMLIFGSNPWSWAERQSVEMARYLWKNYEINGGTWRLETDLRSLHGIERLGKVYNVAGIRNKLYGIGTNFLDVFCGGVPGGALGSTPYIVPMLTNVTSSSLTTPYPRLVGTCESDTEVTFRSGWGWDRPVIDTDGVSWGTMDTCTDCGDWQGVMTASSINFYDNALGHYALYYRTGWRIARDSARWLTDRWYRSPWALSLLSHPPRDLSYTSAVIRAEIDRTGAQSDSIWAAIRYILDSRTCSPYVSSPGSYQDIRESAYCLAYRSLQALFDPVPGARSSAVEAVRDSFINRWGAQQEPEGNYVSRGFEGDLSRVVEVTDGSARVILHKGDTFPADYCGNVALAGEGARLWNDRVTLESDDVSFVGLEGKTIMLTGRLHGEPWSMVSTLSKAQISVANRITLLQPWRGDLGMIEHFAIMESKPAGRGYWESFMAETDANGTLRQPNTLDSHAWYWCRVETPSTLLLDKPYRAESGAIGPYRRMTWQNLTGLGTQPFISGILGWAFHLAADSLDRDHPSVAAGYREGARGLIRWLHDKGLNPVTKGMRYGVGYSNCQGADIAPAFGCWSAAINNERSYNVELFNLLTRDLIAFGTEAVPGFGDDLYNYTYGKPGFASPLLSDGHYGEAVDEAGYTWTLDLATKNYGQAWGVGGGQTWPAIRAILQKEGAGKR